MVFITPSPDPFQFPPSWTSRPGVSGPVVVITPITVLQTIAGSGEEPQTTQYVTSWATTFVVKPYDSASPSAVATNTNANHPVAAKRLSGTHLAAAVVFPVAGIFVFCLLGLYLLKRRRQKKRAKETQGEMATVAGLSEHPPLAKPFVCQPKDSSSHQSTPGLPPIDLEQPAPVAFPNEPSRNDPGRQPFSYAGYFSGIDTSAAETQHSSANGHSYRAMSPDPPPPYAPRSESSASRSNSVCLAQPRPISAAHRLSQGGMTLHERSGVHSPFADPVDDDAESQVPSVAGSDVNRRRGTDEVSVASSVSDRDKETSVHQIV